MAGVPNEGGHRDGPGAAPSTRWIPRRFIRDASGATAVEYTFVVAMIALALVGAMRAYSDKMVTVYNTLAAAITAP